MLGDQFAEELFSLLVFHLNDPFPIVLLPQRHLSVVTENDEEDCKECVQNTINYKCLQVDRLILHIQVVLQD